MAHNDMFFVHEDEMSSIDFEATLAPEFQINDDALLDVKTDLHIQSLLNSMTNIGGEVARLRSEMNGLLTQNTTLIETFDRLKEVLTAKGAINFEDFDLACDVMEENTETLSQAYARKIAN